MAEQTNKQNIEDVLSSIRRLVSDEGATTPRAPLPASRPEKLVLTPQLRVTEPEDPYQTIRALGQPDRTLDDLDETSLEDAPDADVLMSRASDEGRGVPAFDPELEQAFAAPAEEDGPKADSAETRVTDVLPTDVAAQGEDDAAGADEAPMAELAFDEASMDQPFEATLRLAPKGADVASLETVDDSAEAEAPMAFPQEPLDAPQAIPFPQDKVQRASEPKAQDADDVLDEETLREIIAEVVREEFAGQLGERITRNVRKLVRREIRQVLSNEDQDEGDV